MAPERPLRDPAARSLIGAVLTGGSSRRFGAGDKASVIGPHVLSSLRAAGVDPVVAIGGRPSGLAAVLVADRYPGEGPLGGVATALTYAKRGHVLTVTCDLPLIDVATVEAIVGAVADVAPDVGVVAATGGTPHVSVGCWPASWARPLHRAIGSGERRFRHLLQMGHIELVEVAAAALRDADDEATLAELRGMDAPHDPSA